MAIRMTSRAKIPLLLAIAHAAWPCEQIAVLSNDAKYLLLDGYTLETKDVGNLWWKGVWGIDVVLPGSTSDRLAFVSDGVSGGTVRPRDPAAQTAFVVVEGLRDGADTAMDVAVSREYEFQIGDAWWIDGTDELLVWQRQQSVFSVLDKRLNGIDSWAASDDISQPVNACRTGGRLVVGARSHRIIRGKDANIIESLHHPQGARDCKMERLAFGCRVSVGCRRDDRYEKVIIDIASNRVLSTMRFNDPVPAPTDDELQRSPGHRRHMASLAFFADGARLLRQLGLWMPDPPGSDSYRISPGSLLRVLDVKSGAAVVENNHAPPGTVSRVFCRGGEERVVLSTDDRVHLVDLNTLKPIVSVGIPFRRHFVF